MILVSPYVDAQSWQGGTKSSLRCGNVSALHIEIFDALDDARSDWEDLALTAEGSPYQSLAFVQAWFATIGVAAGAQPFVVVARDAAGRPAALLPFAVWRAGPFRIATFPGARDSNANLGLFRTGRVWDGPTLRAILVSAGRARRSRIDGFALMTQPLEWAGTPNPMLELGGRPGPSAAARSELPDTIDAWQAADGSKSARKKYAQSVRRLGAKGEVGYIVARDAVEASRLLDAALMQKQEQAAAGGPPNAYATAASQAFLRRLAAGGTEAGAPLELHALTLDGRPIATFGGLVSRPTPGRGRLCGLILSRTSDEEIARCGPGRLLLHRVVGSAIERGLTAFDLGVGEARYKSEFCEIAEPMFDSFVPATASGRMLGAMFRLARRAKGSVKRSPRLMSFWNRIRPRGA